MVGSYWLLWMAIVAFVLLLGIYILPNPKKSSIDNIYFEDNFEADAERYVGDKKMSWSDKQREFLLQSRTGTSLEQYILLHFVSVGVVFLCALYVFRSIPLAILFSPLGLLYPKRRVKSKRDKLILNFDKHLIEVLDRLISYMRNSTIVRAFEEVVSAKDLHPIIRNEFVEILVDLKANRAVEDAVYNAYKRVGSDSLRLMYIQLKLDRELGLSLPELFASIRGSIVRSFHQKKDAEINTANAVAQGNMIIWFVTVIFGLIWAMAPSIYGVIFESTIGRVILAVCVLMVITGKQLISNIVKS